MKTAKPEVQEAFDIFSTSMRELEEFREKHKAILEEEFRLNNEMAIAQFTAQEKVEMWIDEGQITEDIFIENDILELRVDFNLKKVQFFLKRLYNLPK